MPDRIFLERKEIDEEAMPCNLGGAQLAAGRDGGAGPVGGAELEQRLLPATGGVLRVLLSSANSCLLPPLGLARPSSPCGLLAMPAAASSDRAAVAQRLSDMAAGRLSLRLR